jgi:hypothetical protein
MDKYICNHYQKQSPAVSTPEPPTSTKPLKLCSNQCAKGCALVHPPLLIFKNAYSSRARGKVRKYYTIWHEF